MADALVNQSASHIKWSESALRIAEAALKIEEARVIAAEADRQQSEATVCYRKRQVE
jgi:hypothetical protein